MEAVGRAQFRPGTRCRSSRSGGWCSRTCRRSVCSNSRPWGRVIGRIGSFLKLQAS